jgi:hypothetical protein
LPSQVRKVSRRTGYSKLILCLCAPSYKRNMFSNVFFCHIDSYNDMQHGGGCWTLTFKFLSTCETYEPNCLVLIRKAILAEIVHFQKYVDKCQLTCHHNETQSMFFADYILCVCDCGPTPPIYLVYVTEMKPQNPLLVENVFVFYLNFSHEIWKPNVGVI